MNDIQHFTITIEMDKWQPFNRECEKELDDFLFNLKERQLLPHFGNVKAVLRVG